MIAPSTATALGESANTPRSRTAPGFVIEIGETIFPVYGNATDGWSIEEDDIEMQSPYRYACLDELLFAVLNLCIHSRGSA